MFCDLSLSELLKLSSPLTGESDEIVFLETIYQSWRIVIENPLRSLIGGHMAPQTLRLEEVISCHQKGADNGSEIGTVALESLILLQTDVVETDAKGLARVGIGRIQELAVSIVGVVIYVGEGGEVVLQLSETDVYKLP